MTSQDTTPKGRVCDDSNAELSTDFQDADLLILDFQIEWRIFDLYGRYGVHCVRTTYG